MASLLPEYVILGLLEVRPCHGYHLLEYFRAPQHLGYVWKISTSQLYATLKRLEHLLWIDGREEDSVDAPIRTVYWLTEKGRIHLFEWLNMSMPSASTRHIRTEFLSRIYIARLLKYPIQPIIDAQINACIHQLNILREERNQLDDSLGYLAIDLRIAEMNAILTWIQATLGKKLLYE